MKVVKRAVAHLGVGGMPGARVRAESVLEEGIKEDVGVRELEAPQAAVVEGTEGIWEGAASRGLMCAREA